LSVPVQLIDWKNLFQPALVALLVASLPGYNDEAWVQSPVWPDSLSQVYSGICIEIKISGTHKGFDSVLFKYY